MYVNAYVRMEFLCGFDVTHDHFRNSFIYLIKSLQNIKTSIKFKDKQFGILINQNINKKNTLFVCIIHVSYHLSDAR